VVAFGLLVVTASSVLAGAGVLPTSTQLNWIANQLLLYNHFARTEQKTPFPLL
jgi:hypothetical protein